MKTDRRFLNSIESRLMRGDQATNTGLPNSPTTGTQGFIPKITADGETVKLHKWYFRHCKTASNHPYHGRKWMCQRKHLVTRHLPKTRL